MPYLITTHRHLDDPTAEFLHGALPGVSRRAVVTLEQARKALLRLDDSLYATAMTLPESGGSVGPLPDGTEIHIEPVDRFWLLFKMDCSGHDPRSVREIVDAYNAHSLA